MMIRAAREAETAEIAELQRLVFRPHEPDAAQRYLTYVRGDPNYTLDHSRVIFADGRIVAHLRIWDRALRVRGAELLAAGIGSLCTHPDYRGRGYAKALMRDSEEYFFTAGYDMGLLFSIIGTPFYQAQGWIPIPLPTFEFGSVSARPMPAAVRRLDAAQDLEDVQALYEAHGLIYECAVLRDDDYWTDGPAQVRGTFPTWGAVREGQLTAYATVESDDEEVWIKEACGAYGYEKLAQAVLAGVGDRKLAGSLPRDHDFVRTLEALTGTTAAWDTHDEMMVKGVNWPALHDKLGAEFAPVGPPANEAAFWRGLLGDKPFYSWADIF